MLIGFKLHFIPSCAGEKKKMLIMESQFCFKLQNTMSTALMETFITFPESVDLTLNERKLRVHSRGISVSPVSIVFAEVVQPKKILDAMNCPTGFLQTSKSSTNQREHCSSFPEHPGLSFFFFFFFRFFPSKYLKSVFPFPCLQFLNVDLIFGNEHNSLKENPTESDVKFAYLHFVISPVLRRHCEKQKQEGSRDCIMVQDFNLFPEFMTLLSK